MPRAPDGRKQPTETFKWLRSHHDKILEYQFSIARWLMASLLIINAGGLLSLPNVAEKHVGALDGGPWFVLGLVLAVLTGTLAWFNCNCITAAVDHRTNWDEADYQDSPQADRFDYAAIALAWMSVVVAVLSLSAFTLGAIMVQRGVTAAATQAASPPPPTSQQERAK
jgi:hypothetical protein